MCKLVCRVTLGISLLLIVCIGCSNNKTEEEEMETKVEKTEVLNDKPQKVEDSFGLYYVDEFYNLVKQSVEYKVADHTNKVNINYILYKLREQPEDQNLNQSIPKDIHINKFEYDEKEELVEIDLNSKFNELKPLQDILCRASIVKTITQLPSVTYVVFSVQGEPLLDINGKPVKKLTRDDIIYDSEQYLFDKEKYELSLYFANNNGTKLKIEKRAVTLEQAETLPEKIVKELILGPDSDKLQETIPNKTKLLDIVVSDGICYVDFNESFRKNHIGNEVWELLTIYSIVDSLTELPNINKVQFLINGEKQVLYKGNQDFSRLFLRNLDIVEK